MSLKLIMVTVKLGMTETEMVEVLYIILETICDLTPRIFFQILLNMFFFRSSRPKSKPIVIGMFYRPPNKNDLLNTLSNNFQQFIYAIWVFFHEHSRIAGLQGKGEGISLTPRYHFHPLHRHLDISKAITAESSP